MMFIALMMAAARTSEMSVYFNKTTLLCIPEGCNVQTVVGYNNNVIT
jgi:hypothetical protein